MALQSSSTGAEFALQGRITDNPYNSLVEERVPSRGGVQLSVERSWGPAKSIAEAGGSWRGGGEGS